MNKIIKFPKRTYIAKSFEIFTSGLHVTIAGTLEGFLDFSVKTSDGYNKTYSLTCDEAKILAANLLNSVNDIQHNCLFDKDSLLITKKDKI